MPGQEVPPSPSMRGAAQTGPGTAQGIGQRASTMPSDLQQAGAGPSRTLAPLRHPADNSTLAPGESPRPPPSPAPRWMTSAPSTPVTSPTPTEEGISHLPGSPNLESGWRDIPGYHVKMCSILPGPAQDAAGLWCCAGWQSDSGRRLVSRRSSGQLEEAPHEHGPSRYPSEAQAAPSNLIGDGHPSSHGPVDSPADDHGPAGSLKPGQPGSRGQEPWGQSTAAPSTGAVAGNAVEQPNAGTGPCSLLPYDCQWHVYVCLESGVWSPHRPLPAFAQAVAICYQRVCGAPLHGLLLDAISCHPHVAVLGKGL